VSGWTHKTIDGGQSWSQRLYTFPYPIRAVKCINDTTAFAFGGNLYDEAGGIYSTTDTGLNWNLDVSTGAEMFSFDSMPISSDSIDIWCVGSTGGSTGFVGKLYKARIPGNIIVPVELTSFTALVQSGRVLLNWTTATEINNLGFEVERKIITEENVGEWVLVAFIEGNGTTTEPKDYFYNDEVRNIDATSFKYRLKQIDFNGSFEYSDEVIVENSSQPNQYYLSQNYPDPFNPSTKIKYTIPSVIASGTKQSQLVTLKVYDVLGTEIATLVNEEKPAGTYEVEFGRNLINQVLTSGVYFYQLKAGSFIETKKMLLLK
jgi:hypothetical protein